MQKSDKMKRQEEEMANQINSILENEKDRVKELGEEIGYGYMMSLANECWRENMKEKGYPISGVFIPALMIDIKEDMRAFYREYEE